MIVFKAGVRQVVCCLQNGRSPSHRLKYWLDLSTLTILFLFADVNQYQLKERVLTVRLTGAVEYETGDCDVRRVSAGEFVLVEDTHGKGHLSRHSSDEQTVLWIRLPDGLDLPPA